MTDLGGFLPRQPSGVVPLKNGLNLTKSTFVNNSPYIHDPFDTTSGPLKENYNCTNIVTVHIFIYIYISRERQIAIVFIEMFSIAKTSLTEKILYIRFIH